MALTTAQRSETERHVTVLERAAASGPSDRIATAIMGVLSVFPAQVASPETIMARSIMYREALADLPAWSVERAVQWWNRGENSEGKENYAFPPSPPQMRRLALMACQPLRTELAQLNRLLEAKVIAPPPKSPEMLSRIDEMVARTFGPKEGAAA